MYINFFYLIIQHYYLIFVLHEIDSYAIAYNLTLCCTLKLIKMNVFWRVFRFYYEGFKSMTVGKTLWLIILIKLFIMFVILKLFFFPNYLNTNFDTDEQRSKHVIEELTNPNKL